MLLGCKIKTNNQPNNITYKKCDLTNSIQHLSFPLQHTKQFPWGKACLFCDRRKRIRFSRNLYFAIKHCINNGTENIMVFSQLNIPLFLVFFLTCVQSQQGNFHTSEKRNKKKITMQPVRLHFANFAQISQFWWNLINSLTYANQFEQLKPVKLWILELTDTTYV